MQLVAAKILTFTDAATGAVVFSAPVPCLSQIEACIALEPVGPAKVVGGHVPGLEEEGPVARQRRYLAQCLALVCPPAPSAWALRALAAAWLHRRRARRWLRSLQYPQLLDVYRKLMLAVQGVDFDTLEEFERALEAQKKSTPAAPPNPETMSSSGSAS